MNMEKINIPVGNWDCSATNRTFLNCFTQEPIDYMDTSVSSISTMVRTNISCPRDIVDQTNFIRSTHLGLCQCEASIQAPQVKQQVEANDSPTTITTTSGEVVEPFVALPSCDCHACPHGSRIGFGIWCDDPIVGDCYNISCSGRCNDLFFMCCGFDNDGEPEESSEADDSSPSGAADVPLLLLRYHYVPCLSPLSTMIGLLLLFRWVY